jgi:hypothetical protein
MSPSRSVVFIVLALAGCHDEEYITVVSEENAPTNFDTASSATGLTGFDEQAAAADVGSDGLPRLVFRREVGSNVQLLFTRKTAAGLWTTPLLLSADDADAKDSVSAFVTTSNDFTHVFWLEASQVHYARVNSSDPPALDALGTDTVISQQVVGLAAPVPGSAGSLATGIDRIAHTVFALWIESFTSGGSADAVPVAGEVAAAGPVFGNRVLLVTPDTDANSAVSSSPILRVSSAGAVHVGWIGTLADNTASRFRYSQRTGAGAWTASPGESVSDTAGNTIEQPDLLLAGDGDVFAVWVDATATDVLADRRPSGGAWGTDGVVYDAAPATISVRPALEPASQILNVVWREGTAGGTVSFKAQRQSAADLGGTWLATPETLFSVATAAADSIGFAAWADSTNRVVVAYQAPPVAGDFSRTRIQIHASAAATFDAAKDLTAPFVLPCSGLTVAIAASGTAILVWEQGSGDSLPLSDVFGAVYASGGGVGGTGNISNSASTGSQDPFVLRMTDAPVGHVFWQETTAAPDIRDVSYARTQ